MTASAEIYAARIDAVIAQHARVHGESTPSDPWAGAARRFRYDPHRRLDANLETLASYVQPEDVLIDVGGGAGRVCLPMALRCRNVINVDPSASMRAEFAESAAEAGIENARFIQAEWIESESVQGDIVTTANVTYFVKDIARFVSRLEEAARRRVVINVWSVPPPNQSARLFHLVYGEEQEKVPGHQQLLPVLWDMGILPDVYVLPGGFREGELPPTQEAAVEDAMRGRWLIPKDRDRARGLIELHFQELYKQDSRGFLPLWESEVRELQITWEKSRE